MTRVIQGLQISVLHLGCGSASHSLTVMTVRGMGTQQQHRGWWQQLAMAWHRGTRRLMAMLKHGILHVVSLTWESISRLISQWHAFWFNSIGYRDLEVEIYLATKKKPVGMGGRGVGRDEELDAIGRRCINRMQVATTSLQVCWCHMYSKMRGPTHQPPSQNKMWGQVFLSKWLRSQSGAYQWR